ncbi:MAG: hypothetical protein DI603_02130 [Roseateles depolymerans]|uniref:MASE1 domain-containing protein n=1 Tax=Roseateles depolymerans TaxID=76731 RepID=A0A2W5E3Y4_9BURK|nr:MAG: hypothetical protein DI603_02130 [Roseateles depolymerans]
MERWRLQAAMVMATMGLFVAMLVLNEWLFTSLEFARGINFIYLPGGVRLLSTLLFAQAGALGLLLVSWLVCFLYFFPDDVVRSFMGGVLAAAAPYGVYLLAQRRYGIGSSLANLTPRRLLLLSVAYSLASPALHHLWFVAHGDAASLRSFAAMAIGDLSGTLIVLYLVKGLLSMWPTKKT